MKFLIFIIFFLTAEFLFSQTPLEDDSSASMQQPPVRNIIPTEPPPHGEVTQVIIEEDDGLGQNQTDTEPENRFLEDLIRGTPVIQINIIPKLPDPSNKNKFRVQVGAFKNSTYARNCFDKLTSIGLNPAFEQFDSIIRVVIPGVNAADIAQTAARIGEAGFSEVLLREEN